MSIQLNQSDSSTETETIDNPERGCGYMEDGKAYLKADMAPGGDLPAFVTFNEAIPFKENRKRSYTRFPGIQFELSVTGEGGMTETEPEAEVWQHLERLDRDRPTGATAGEMVEFQSQDLLLSVGKTHYPTVEDFVNESRVHGVSKAISVTSGNSPPEVNPGRTRLFLIHPRAVDVEQDVETTAGEMQDGDELLAVDGEPADDEELRDLDDDMPVTVHRELSIPGVFGYTYLTRVVYTEDPDGNTPAYIQEYEQTGDLDVVQTGRELPYSEQAGFNDDGDLEGDAEAALETHYGDPRSGMDMDTEVLETYPDLQEQYPALEAPTIEKMEKADLGSLEGTTVDARRPPEGEDHMVDGEGALAVIRQDGENRKVMPTNILSIDEESRAAVTQVGPYKVTVRSLIGGNGSPRAVSVTNTR